MSACSGELPDDDDCSRGLPDALPLPAAQYHTLNTSSYSKLHFSVLYSHHGTSLVFSHTALQILLQQVHIVL